jgi:hypothetical protein
MRTAGRAPAQIFANIGGGQQCHMTRPPYPGAMLMYGPVHSQMADV